MAAGPATGVLLPWAVLAPGQAELRLWPACLPPPLFPRATILARPTPTSGRLHLTLGSTFQQLAGYQIWVPRHLCPG